MICFAMARDRMIISHTENKPFFSVELHIERFLLGEFYRRIMVICYRDLPSYPDDGTSEHRYRLWSRLFPLK